MSVATKEKEEDKILIHNRGRIIGNKTVARKIIFPSGWDDKGHPLLDAKSSGKQQPINNEIEPGKHKHVTREQYEHLKANFPEEIINVNDINDLQAQYKNKEEIKPRTPGTYTEEEMEAIVQKRVAAATSGTASQKDDPEKEGSKKNDEGKKKPSSTFNRVTKAKELEAMDRGELVNIIELEDIDVRHSPNVALPELKSRILNALEEKSKAE